MFNVGLVKGEWGRWGLEFGGGRRMDSLEWGEGGIWRREREGKIWRREGVFEVGRGSLKWGGGFGGGGVGGYLSNGVF